MDQPTRTGFEQAEGVQGWRPLDGGVSAWFDAPTTSAGAQLVRRVADLVGSGPLPDVDLRAAGLRVRIGSDRRTEDDVALAQAISAAAGELGLVADPAALQSVRLVIDTTDQRSLASFWQPVLAYESVGADVAAGADLADVVLADPARRDPTFAFAPLGDPRPLRNRVHVDVVRPPEVVASVKTGLELTAGGPYGLAVADPDGNEVDLVPGDRLPEGPDTSDWWVLFSAMTFYPVTSAAQASELASVVAGLADDAGIPLLVDLRPDGVTIDSGKDRWEDDATPSGSRFAALAGGIQAAARALGLSADPSHLRFVQLGFDAVDIPAVRAFWTTLLGYEHDPREFLTDIVDPRRLTPVLFFQNLDDADDRRAQRNRLRLDLVVPADQVGARVATALAAGGRLLADDAPGRRTLADPEGNEVTVVG